MGFVATSEAQSVLLLPLVLSGNYPFPDSHLFQKDSSSSPTDSWDLPAPQAAHFAGLPGHRAYKGPESRPWAPLGLVGGVRGSQESPQEAPVTPLCSPQEGLLLPELRAPTPPKQDTASTLNVALKAPSSLMACLQPHRLAAPPPPQPPDSAPSWKAGPGGLRRAASGRYSRHSICLRCSCLLPTS